MSDLTDVVGAAAAGANPISSIVGLGKDLIDRFIPDPAAKLAATQHLVDVQADLQTKEIAEQMANVQAASQNILHDGLVGVRKAFGYSFVGMLIWNWVVVPLLHRSPCDIPTAFTVAFTTLLLGTSAMNLAQKVSSMPGDSSVSILGVKVGNKS